MEKYSFSSIEKVFFRAYDIKSIDAALHPTRHGKIDAHNVM